MGGRGGEGGLCVWGGFFLTGGVKSWDGPEHGVRKVGKPCFGGSWVIGKER